MRRHVITGALLAGLVGTGAAAPAHASTGWTYVPVTVTQEQQQDSWCVPAASVGSLWSVGVHTTQAQDALGMKTDASFGTYASNALPYLNATTPLSGMKFFLDDDGTAALMQQEITYEVSKGWAPMVPVFTDLLPWYPTSVDYGHDLLVTGDDPSTGQVQLWDPANDGYGGVKVTSFSILWSASQGPSGDETTHGYSFAMEPAS